MEIHLTFKYAFKVKPKKQEYRLPGRWDMVTTIFICLATMITAQAQQEKNIVEIHVEINNPVGAMTPVWAWIGYDEPNYTYLPDGRDLLSDFAGLSRVPVYVRAHNLLNTSEGSPVALKWGSTNAFTEDAEGNPVYNWSMVDRIVDTWIERGMKPLMEIGFMPKALTTHEGPYRHYWQPGDPYNDIYTGWAYPPNDYDKWEELVFQWVKHSVERYGEEEVTTWWWQLWNEPNIGYWQGSWEEYFKLYDYTAHAVKRALPAARIGGPNTAPSGDAPRFMKAFMEHCRNGRNHVTGGTGTPLDFFGFHAKGSPRVTSEGYVRMGMGSQLRQFELQFELLNTFPEYKDLPVILGESDPEGCAACGRHFGYQEMDYRNGTMFSSYTASSFAKKFELADQFGVNFQGAVSWTFTFPGQPLFSGFRSFSTTHNINKPVLNVMRMFGMMGGDRIRVNSSQAYSAGRVISEGVRSEPDINGLASREDNRVSVMVWNYHDDHTAGYPAHVQLTFTEIPAQKILVHHYRIDEYHSNAFTVWREMGAPQQLTDSQLHTLKKAGQLELLTSPEWINARDGTAGINFELPRHGVSFLQLTW